MCRIKTKKKCILRSKCVPYYLFKYYNIIYLITAIKLITFFVKISKKKKKR